MNKLEAVIYKVYMEDASPEDIWITIAREVRKYLYEEMNARVSTIVESDYRLGYEDGIRESARWILGDA